jgi:hypothetical protein
MLIRNQHIDENCILGIWEITESKEELLALYPKNLQQEAIKQIRKTNYRMVIGKAYAFPFAERRKNGLSQKQRATLPYG